MLTLRQIEVVRAVLIAGSIAGAARLLNVAQPGVSRTMKHLDSSLGFQLFLRRNGRYVPSPEANNIFDQFHGMHKQLEKLQYSILQMEQGRNVEFAFASVPSIANSMVPQAIVGMKSRHPGLLLNFDIVKLEEAIDYLLLERGELALMSYRLDQPGLEFQPLAKGNLVCICPRDHPLATRTLVTAAEISQYPLIGIDPSDPYGGIIADLFKQQGLQYRIEIRARFGHSICSLVEQGLGVSVIDSFTIANWDRGKMAVIAIREPTEFQTYVATRKDVELSNYARTFVSQLRNVMRKATQPASYSISRTTTPRQPPRAQL